MAIYNGTNEYDYIIGSEEDDEIYGFGSNDWLEGGLGNDIIDGGTGWNRIIAGDGNDTVVFGNGRADGGTGNNTLTAENSSTAISVVLEDGTGYGNIYDASNVEGSIISSMSIENIQNITGGAGDDYIVGNSSDNILRGNGGNDNIRGIAGNNTIYGGEGDDYLVGGFGNDTIYGTAGNNNIIAGGGDNNLYGGSGRDWFTTGIGSDNMDGNIGRNTVDYRLSDSGVTVNLETGTGSGGYAQGDTYTNIQQVIGSDFDDVLTGNDENNYFIGGTGADTIDGKGGINTVSYERTSQGVTIDLQNGIGSGGDAEGDSYTNIQTAIGSNGNDILYGQDGVDNYLYGGAGNDTITGSEGSDRLTGGQGNDVFYYTDKTMSNSGEYDTIEDFTQGEDTIWLNDANIGDYNDLVFTQSEGNTIISHQTEDFQIHLTGLYNLQESDFNNNSSFETFGFGVGGRTAWAFESESGGTTWVGTSSLLVDGNYNYTSINDGAGDQINVQFEEMYNAGLKNTDYMTVWVTNGWQESWFSIDSIQKAIDNGITPVINYWYYGDGLAGVDGETAKNIVNSGKADYLADADRLGQFLSQLDGDVMLVMEPEFNKNSTIEWANSAGDGENFGDIIAQGAAQVENALAATGTVNLTVGTSLTDTGSRGANSSDPIYGTASQGDSYAWADEGTDAMIQHAIDAGAFDFIGFQEMLGQFSRNPSNPSVPISYTAEDLGLDDLAERIANYSEYLNDTYDLPVFLSHIALATSTWDDLDSDGVIDTGEVIQYGWEEEMGAVWQDIRDHAIEYENMGMLGISAMSLFDDPHHDYGGYQYFIDNEYALGLVGTDAIPGTGDINLEYPLDLKEYDGESYIEILFGEY